MHNNSYNIKVACLGNKNFINSLDEVKDFFGFSLSLYDIDQTKSLDNLIGKYNILLFESLEKNNYLLISSGFRSKYPHIFFPKSTSLL